MTLTETQKNNIRNEYKEWFNHAYGDKSLEERKKLGAFFTPPEITIKMIEKFDTLENKTILDPTCGSGNLLAACIIAGANPKLVYGNEFDPTFVKICQERLGKLGVPYYHIHQGDALKKECLDINNFKEGWAYKEVKRATLW